MRVRSVGVWMWWRVVGCVCVASARQNDAGAGPHQQVVLLVGACIDCCHTQTELGDVTDVGLKAFSAALGSNSTITTVKLKSKSEWLIVSMSGLVVSMSGAMCLCACGCVRSEHGLWCGVYVLEVHGECMLAPGWTGRLLGWGVGSVTLLVVAYIDC